MEDDKYYLPSGATEPQVRPGYAEPKDVESGKPEKTSEEKSDTGPVGPADKKQPAKADDKPQKAHKK